MTEEQWLECTDPAAMLEALRGHNGVDSRKIRDFIIACLCRVRGHPEAVTLLHTLLVHPDAYAAASEALRYAAAFAADVSDFKSSRAEILRDYVGNPFRSFVMDPTWLTPAVAELASQIDLNGAFDLMPALGAALSDAGCKDPQVLEHCRETRHVSGYWLISALLGLPC